LGAADRNRAVSAAGSGSPDPVRDDELDALLSPLVDFPLVILAVSGGADSTAMMHLASRWMQRRARGDVTPAIMVASVDHGLRASSGAEAEWVIGEARKLDFEARLLEWSGDKPLTGIQDAARTARYRLLADLARSYGGEDPVAVVTAHTEDDQAETLLMRLARGSGLDGLAAMAPARALDDEGKVVLLRPLLGVAGARLRATLRAAGAQWIEDPSNEADRFERVRIRKAAAVLSDLGFANDRLALSARRLARARDAVEYALAGLEERVHLDLHSGAFASFTCREWNIAPAELRLRLLGRLIASYGGEADPVRLAQLEALDARMLEMAFEGATLGGAVVSRHGESIRVWREMGRDGPQELKLQPGMAAVWDRRFRVRLSADGGAPVEVRALGLAAFSELRQRADRKPWPNPAVPAAAAAGLPAFWQGEKLLTVPYFVGFQDAPAHWRDTAGLYSAEFLG